LNFAVNIENKAKPETLRWHGRKSANITPNTLAQNRSTMNSN